MVQNHKNLIKQAVYQRKIDFGTPVTLYKIKWEVDRTTRKKTITEYNAVEISRAIVEDTRLVRGFAYDLAYISANKDFTAGGLYDTNDKTVTIDKDDLADWSEIDLDQFVTINGKRYDVTRVNDEDYAYVIDVREHKGQASLIGLKAYSVLTLIQDTTNA